MEIEHLLDDCYDEIEKLRQNRLDYEHIIRDWWYSIDRRGMTSREAAQSLIRYLDEFGLKIVAIEHRKLW
jgi:hypothetical protein